MSETDTALEAIHPATGELVDVRNAETGELAQIMGRELPEIREQLHAFEATISDELVRRLDRRGSWTLRAGAPDAAVQWEINAPSPTAGTTVYDVEPVRELLVALLDEDAIDPDLAREVLRRKVVITAHVGVDVPLGVLVTLMRDLNAIAGTPVYDVKVDSSEDVQKAGIGKLEKAGYGDRVQAIARTVPTGARKAKVTAKTRKR